MSEDKFIIVSMFFSAVCVCMFVWAHVQVCAFDIPAMCVCEADVSLVCVGKETVFSLNIAWNEA